jgi:signal transduction histidine kinase
VSAPSLVSHPGMRVALSLPVSVLFAYAVVVGGVRRPVLAIVLLGVVLALTLATLALANRERDMPAWWQATATVIGVGVLPVLLVEALAAPVATFSLLFVVVLIVGAFTYQANVRVPLLVWTLLAWTAALWWDGLHELDLLLLHVGAGGLIALSVMQTADALEQAVAGAGGAAEAAERRAELLSRTLAVHTLEREEVLQAVIDGLEDVGFAAVSLRVPVDGRLELAAGLGLREPLARRLEADEQLPGRALASGQVEIIHDRRRLDELGVEPEAVGAIAMPVVVDGHVEAVVTAITTDGPIRAYQREAIELLADLAARGLRRARIYASDEQTVTELQRLESRTQDFVSTVSHELRTPLTVVQGLGRTLRDRWDDLDPDRRTDLLRRVNANAARLAEMVRSLLDTSAFEEGRITLQPQPIEVRVLLADLLHRLANVTAAHPTHVRIAEDLWVWADRSLLGHVLENLLTNTSKHTAQGTRIDIIAEPVGEQHVEIAVVDDGPGIPAEDLPHVRDRFYRGGDPLSRPAGGLGLGLALVSQILAAHGSELEITSEEGQGARFAFRLERAWPSDQQGPTSDESG